MDIKVRTTQRCSRESCARFLLGGDFMGTDQDGGKANSGPKYEYKTNRKDGVDSLERGD